MKKVFILICTILFAESCVFADVFSHPANIENVKFPDFETVSCKFTQTKTIPNSSSALKSGGDFRFVKGKGVIFETDYPLQMITTYTSDENKRISNIIESINKKNYSYMNQNFNVFYEKKESNWILALKPKKDSKINSHINSIIIEGAKYINKLDINTLKNGSTKINFTECR